jgi:uncharacterized repeat protein (TIGR03987 family)
MDAHSIFPMILLISLALAFYSIGVWGERFQGRLKLWHLIFFWAGLFFDTTGTGMMFAAARTGSFNVHGLSGMLAISLMLIHALWASVVVATKREKAIVTFHHFSVLVWAIWLIPYFTGVYMGAVR